jgi:hypothetical protein
MSRSTELLYAVKRNTQNYWNDLVVDPEIWRALNQAQRQVIIHANALEYELSLDTVIDQESYDLAVNDRKIVKGIKQIVTPTDWDSEIEIIGSEQWDAIKQLQLTDDQPAYMMIHNHKLYFAPAPSDVQTLTIFTYLSDATEDMDESTEPEVDRMWDDAMEFYASSVFLKKPERQEFLEMFWTEINSKKGMSNAKFTAPKIREADW